ncbi:unnamed protein product, partial [marine sediment metagenome]
MNVIGHPYVAFKVFGRLTEDLVLGSYLPDIVPFVPNSAFEFEEIHEGGLRFLEFLDKHHPERRDLALGMLCHSVEFGADKFSRSIEKRFEDRKEEFARRIAEASNISLEIASKYRFHNFLWWGVDVQLLWHRQEFVEELARKTSQLDVSGAADLLAGCFGKEASAVSRDISFILKLFTPERLFSVHGLAEIWKDMAAVLPEKDQVDIEKTERLFTDCATLVEGCWEEIV